MYLRKMIFSIVLVSSLPLLAENSDETNDEIRIIGDIPDRLMTPDRQTILEEGIFDLSDSLYKEPGFSRIRRGGTATDLMLRGFQGDNLNFLMDGQRMYGACPNRMDPPMAHLDLGSVESFHVIRGPYDVRNPGSLGGSVEVETRKPMEGIHTTGNSGVSSFGGSFVNADASYGGDRFSILVGGSYSESLPFRDGNGDRFTSAYPDFWGRQYIAQEYAPLNMQENMALNLLRDRAPSLYSDYRTAAPSRNRYRYTDRDRQAYTRRGGWTTMQFRPVDNHELELQISVQEADNVMYPYLLMDANYDHSTRVRGSYSITEISERIHEFRIEAYTSTVDHLMTDERRCSSTSDPLCLVKGTRPYGMKTDASTETHGGKIETTVLVDDVSSLALGVDYYDRNWNTETTNRSRHFRDMPGMGPQPYRTQAAIPDVTTENMGAYLDYERNLSDSLTLSSGLRYDHSHSYAGRDRRILYDVYYPQNDLYVFDYQNVVFLDERIDAEIYLPESPPERKASAFSGYLKLDYDIDRQWSVYGGAGYAVRPPDPQELYFALQRMGTQMMPDFVGNPELDNVRNSQVDTGVIFSGSRLRAELNGYYSRVNGHIILSERSQNTADIGTRDYLELAIFEQITGQDPTVNNRYARTYRNVEAEIYGGELAGILSVGNNWYLSSTASYTRGINRTESRELPEISPLRGTVAIRWDIDTYFAELEGEFADVQDRFDPRVQEKRTPGYGIANVKLGWQQNGLRLIGGIRNLLDRQYFDHLSYNRDFWSSGVIVAEPGRTYYATFQWDF